METIKEVPCPKWCYHWDYNSSLNILEAKQKWFNSQNKLSKYDSAELEDLNKLIDKERKRLEIKNKK